MAHSERIPTLIMEKSQPVTNLQMLSKSRKKLQNGDVFAMLFPDDLYLFGRIVSTEALTGSIPAILIYVYEVRSDVMEVPERKELRPDRLLVPPMMTNRLGWSRGVFQTIANIPLDEDDVLKPHCFVYRSMAPRFPGGEGRYFDELSNELPGPVGVVGEFGLESFRTIDDVISKALGFELVPE